MSVVVRMEMPQHCGECNLYVDGWCYALTPDSPQEKEWYASHKERPPMCPIICKLPEGHGRLVDMRDIEQMEVSASDKQDEYFVGWNDAIKICQTATTIVPAEAERSET